MGSLRGHLLNQRPGRGHLGASRSISAKEGIAQGPPAPPAPRTGSLRGHLLHQRPGRGHLGAHLLHQRPGWGHSGATCSSSTQDGVTQGPPAPPAPRTGSLRAHLLQQRPGRGHSPLSPPSNWSLFSRSRSEASAPGRVAPRGVPACLGHLGRPYPCGRGDQARGSSLCFPVA